MMRLLLFLIICFQWIEGNSQNIIVVDSIDKSSLSFVAIKYQDGGMYTNEIGQFDLNQVKGNYLQLLLLGYKTKDLLKTQLKDTIYLSSNPTELDEVTIIKYLEKKISYKKPKNTNFFGSSILSSRMGICLILIPDSLIVDVKIDKISFYFKRELGMQSEKKEAMENVDAFVRINIHDVVNEKAENKIFASEHIKINSFKKDEFVLDVSEEFISIPKSGIAISIEMIGYYDKNFNEVGDRGYVRPMLTLQKYKHFKAITYKDLTFRTDGEKMILMSDFLKQLGADSKHIDRNLSIGLTLSKCSY